MDVPVARKRAEQLMPLRILDQTFGSGLGHACLIAAYAFVARVLLAINIPPWQSPDEPKHFEYVRVLVDKRDELWGARRLPIPGDAIPSLQQQIIASMARFHFWDFLGVVAPNRLPANFSETFGTSMTQLHRPSLYYDLGAVLMLPMLGQTLENQLLAMRVLSAVITALAVWPAYAIGRLVSPRDGFVPVACAAMTAMLPMAVFIGGMMSVDNLLLLVGMLAVFSMTRGVVAGLTWRVWLLILGSVVLGLLTKRGAVILLPGVLLCGVIWFVRLQWAIRGWVLAGAAAIMVVVLGFVGGWLGRALPTERFMSTLVAYSLNYPGQLDNLLGTPLGTDQTWQIIGVELDAYFMSFWGIFGWFNVLLAPWVYMALLITTGLCGLGCLRWALDRGNHHEPRLSLLVLFVTLIISALIAGVAERLAYYSFGQVPQGRYLFVVLGAIAPLYAVGLRAWLPARLTSITVPSIVLIGSLLALDVYAYFGAILPFYSRVFP
jgi:hypothetical protein